MVDHETLACLDGLQWLRTGDRAAELFGCSQSRISRGSRQVQQIFGITCCRNEGEWQLHGDLELLMAERQVHQLFRWRSGTMPLRLEAAYWINPLLPQRPVGWIKGLCDLVGIQRPMQLLRERIIDGWITSLPDVPDDTDSEFAVFPLYSMPVHLLVAPDHPLLNKTEISLASLSDFPSLALPEGAYPKVEACLKSIGLWSDPVRMARYREDRWEGHAADQLVIAYGTALSMQACELPLKRLPLTLPLEYGDAFVVRREFGDYPQVQNLIQFLLAAMEPLLQQYPEIQLLS